MGRHLEFTQEIADVICDRLMDGESLKSICSEPDMPARVTVIRWAAHIPSFGVMYAHAREEQAETLFDDMLHIADTPQLGVKTITKSSGVETIEGDMIDHRRLQVDTRKWAASKLRPRKYGDTGRDQAAGTGNESVVRVEGALPGEFGKDA